MVCLLSRGLSWTPVPISWGHATARHTQGCEPRWPGGVGQPLEAPGLDPRSLPAPGGSGSPWLWLLHVSVPFAGRGALVAHLSPPGHPHHVWSRSRGVDCACMAPEHPPSWASHVPGHTARRCCGDSGAAALCLLPHAGCVLHAGSLALSAWPLPGGTKPLGQERMHWSSLQVPQPARGRL